ncbi:unnamed protein product [Zymoseptoria tritici ST99CH_3D1]|nr:unnamed protein product [Zymoseptoria tritici ST99CH_3D1]
MHPACFKLPNIWFCGGSVSSLPPNHASFELPAAYVAGLHELRHLGPDDKGLTETQKRMPLITLKGDSCVKAKMGSSKGNFLTASYIFNTIIPMLNKMFDKNTKKMVTLITPYKMQHTLYKSMMFKECMANGRTDDEYPRFATVESSIGREAPFVIVDMVIHGLAPRDVGFLKEDDRACVMITRGKVATIFVVAEKGEDRHPWPELPPDDDSDADGQSNVETGWGNSSSEPAVDSFWDAPTTAAADDQFKVDSFTPDTTEQTTNKPETFKEGASAPEARMNRIKLTSMGSGELRTPSPSLSTGSTPRTLPLKPKFPSASITSMLRAPSGKTSRRRPSCVFMRSRTARTRTASTPVSLTRST